MIKPIRHQKLLEELEQKYGHSTTIFGRFHYMRKKYLWVFCIGGAKFLKRFIDVTLSIFFLIFFSPLILLIALSIKLSDGGPVLFITKRVGKWGREFDFPKFRSMKINSHIKKKELEQFNAHPLDIKFKMKKDPRVTSIGYILRKSSLDELPQLWCVLKGDMSIVGPRPPLPEEVAFYTLEQRRRLDAKPGLTCIWQVSGRSEIPFNKQVELDIAYIESRSILLDLKLIIKTIPAILCGRGAY